jgi:hypothetical protein
MRWGLAGPNLSWNQQTRLGVPWNSGNKRIAPQKGQPSRTFIQSVRKWDNRSLRIVFCRVQVIASREDYRDI